MVQTVESRGGVIAAGNPQTAAAGVAMLERGGNAVDAAVAAAFASFIAEIGVVHLGGSGIAQIFEPATGRSVAYDFFSAMPGLGATHLPANLDFTQVTIDYGATTQNFHLGRGAVAVPGNINGLCRLATDFGRLPLARVLEPALQLAQDGAVLDDFQAATCELLRPLYTHTEGMRRIFLRNGRMVRSGDRFTIPHLAETLNALADQGDALLHGGQLGHALITDHQLHGGLITTEDLTNYRAQRRPPIRVAYRGYEVLLPPPCSSGGVLIAFTLKVLNHFDLGKQAHGSAGHLCLLAEVMAATSRARPFWEKAAAEQTPAEAVDYFLNDEFIGLFVQEVERAIATGRPSVAAPEPSGRTNTSHLSVIDGDGMAVALTTTAGESAGYVVPGTGFIPNNILGEEDLNPSGFHLWPAGDRIPTMMAPTFVTEAGHIRLVVGSGGSNRIRSAILQTLVNLLDYEMTLDAAVNAPRVHFEDGILQCEFGYDESAAATLEARGYIVNRWPVRSIYFGGAHSVSRTPEGRLVAAGDNRRGGATAKAR